MNARSLLHATAVVAILSSGCTNLLDQSSTTPSPTAATIDMMSGSWASVSSATLMTDTCTDFHWTVSTISGSVASGTFTAKCFTSMIVSGTASGTLSGSVVTWTAAGAGTSQGDASCPFALSGSATFDGTQFRIPFTGTTCAGPVSGAEILRKS